MTAPLTDLAAVQTWLASSGQSPYRLRQLRRWLYQTPIESFQQMSDLPQTLRAQLEGHFSFWSTTIERHQTSADGTEKLLVGLADGASIECVLLRDGARRTVCLSSQVGCAMGCIFCASGLDGVERSLRGFEIVEQALRLRRLVPLEERLSHLVMMGMGEPLANLPGVLEALEVVSSPEGLGISPRRITISTVGLPAGIRRLAEVPHPYHLAISLHAPNDELRSRLVPANRRIGIDAILEAADNYFVRTGRRVTYEYVLLGGINDQPQHARELAARLTGRQALLNVIPYNPVAGLELSTPSAASAEAFRRTLVAGGINVQFRERKGDQIDAACGQLRRTRFPAGEPAGI